MQRYPQVKISVHAIRNDYFGGNVSVAGLVTGTDIIKQCKDNLQSDTIAVPEVMLRDEKKIVFSMILHCRSWAKPWAAAPYASPPTVPGAAARI